MNHANASILRMQIYLSAGLGEGVRLCSVRAFVLFFHTLDASLWAAQVYVCEKGIKALLFCQGSRQVPEHTTAHNLGQ